MITFKKIGFTVLLWGICTLSAQTTEYLIIDAPIGAQSSSKVLTVKWAGLSRSPSYDAPDSGTIYYDRSPGGGNLSNYRYSIKKFWVDTITHIEQNNILDLSGTVRKRGTCFKAQDQAEMGFGVFYCIVAFPCKNVLGINDTFVSNEFVLMVESPNAVDWISPGDSINDLTPSFTWNANSGVPYYHIILSDDAISIDTNDSGNVDLSGLSIIWQAITPNTQMVYGAPDPSHTITADPPPLSPGKRYTWLVLNNYGNHPAFSSTKVKLPPGEFVIRGKSLNKPVPVYPKNLVLNSAENKKISFKWTNLDSNANTYKIYAYIGSEFEGINAQLVVWQTEVSASVLSDTMSVEIDAASILTSNRYVWNVIAVDNKGAGTVGDTAGFRYDAPAGTLKIYTRELIRVPKGDSIIEVINNVGLVEVKVEVLDGSLEAPLLFYTDLKGNLDRERPTGAYRITAIKSEFESQTKTITLHEGETLEETFYLERPEATIYGKVLDEAAKGINLANVYGVSDLSDTISTQTDASGNFILKCYGSDWRIWSEMTGYKTVLSSKVTVVSAQNLNFGPITMVKNPFTLSGVVKNSDGNPLLGVKIQIYQSGSLIDELSSTPQNGVFSFSIPAGTYTIAAEKTGFTSYNTTLDMLSSKTITVTMQPGAAVINGYVYGKTWVSSRNNYVYAPVTSATVKFVKLDGADTVTVISDYTYGNLKTSLPGGQTYLVYSSASGFGVKNQPCTLITQLKTTQTFYDTLNAFATLNGSVKLGSGTALGNCIINLLSIPDETIVASGKSNSDGSFEIQGIRDGLYTMMAGKDGYVLDSIEGNDSVTIRDGRPDKSTIAFFMKAGDKTIKWHASENGSVKIKSPLQKTLTSGDSLAKAGAGTYVVQFDAKSDTVIDCSYHRFVVHDSESMHIDTIALTLSHRSQEQITLVNGYAKLILTSTDLLDSVKLYYKDETSNSYSMTNTFTKSNQFYTFDILPQRDGSTMLYYFIGYKGNNIFGYEQEKFDSYILPDRTRLSKFEILPSSQDTLIYPSSYKAEFSFKGYISSAFIEDSAVNGQSINWSIADAQGCTLLNSTGLSIKIQTGIAGTLSSPVRLTVTIDTAVTKLVKGVSSVLTVPFKVSGTALKSIRVRRIDSRNPNPITTSVIDRAEFAADGIDVNGNVLKISPQWSVYPAMAGKITSDGIFKPSSKFVGIVHIYALSDGTSGEYVNDAQVSGLKVRFVVVNKNIPDTATNGNGCSIIFPPNVVNGNDIGVIEVAHDTLNNKVELYTGKYKVLSSNAYEIKQLENISLNTSNDSIQLLLSIPDGSGSNTSNQDLYLGWWNADSLKWDILNNSFVNNDAVGAKLSHFSKYTIMSEAKNNGYLSISPNAFSPYVNQGQVNPLKPYYGTCIQFQIQSQKQVNGKVVIYNVLGDVVWSMNIDNMSSNPYQVWWDGRAVSHAINSQRITKGVGNGGEIILAPKGDKMCRNGRYFVLFTGSEQIDKKHYRYMKPVVLMK